LFYSLEINSSSGKGDQAAGKDTVVNYDHPLTPDNAPTELHNQDECYWREEFENGNMGAVETVDI